MNYFLFFIVIQVHLNDAQVFSTFARLPSPSGIAFDSADNLFVCAAQIARVTRGGVVNSSFIVGYSGNQIAIDRNDNLYITSTRNKIQKFDSSGKLLDLAFGGTLPFLADAMAFDSNGSLFVLDVMNHNVWKLNAVGQLENTPFATNLAVGVGGLTFDLDGNLYAATAGGIVVQRFDSSGAGSVFATGLVRPTFIVADCTGTLYVSGFNDVTQIGSGVVIDTFGHPDFNRTGGLAIDKRGNLYVASMFSDTIIKIILPTPRGRHIGDVGCLATTTSVTVGPKPTSTSATTTTTTTAIPVTMSSITPSSTATTAAATSTSSSTVLTNSQSSYSTSTSTNSNSIVNAKTTSTTNASQSSSTPQTTTIPAHKSSTSAPRSTSAITSTSAQITSVSTTITATKIMMTGVGWEVIVASLGCALILIALLIVVIRGFKLWWRKHNEKLLTVVPNDRYEYLNSNSLINVELHSQQRGNATFETL